MFLILRLVATVFIVNPQNRPYVDQINNNIIDNNVKILRLATSQVNNFNRVVATKNTSGIKGVSYEKRVKTWRTEIKTNGKKIHIF